MSNSKKSTKKPQQKKKNVHSSNSSTIGIIISVVLIVALIGGVLFDRLYQPVLLKIQGDKYHMNDLAYYFYNEEAEYNYYASMFGGDIWNQTADDSSNTTIRDTAIENAKNTALETEILYREALAKNYSLTKEEKKTIETDVNALLKQEGTSGLIEKYDLTKSYLTKMNGKKILSERYRKDQIDALDIDDNAIKATVKPEDYRQYDIEYITIPTQTTDENGKSTPLSSEEKEAAFDKINALYDKAQTTTDWSTLVPKDEKELTYTASSFLENDEKFDKDFKTMMMAMENNTVSRVYEAKDGYYIVRMKNNNSSESFDNAVKEAISKEENTRFTKEFDKNILPKYKTQWNTKAVKKIPMGNTTVAQQQY